MAIPVSGDHPPMTWAILLKKPSKRFTVSDLEKAVVARQFSDPGNLGLHLLDADPATVRQGLLAGEVAVGTVLAQYAGVIGVCANRIVMGNLNGLSPGCIVCLFSPGCRCVLAELPASGGLTLECLPIEVEQNYLLPEVPAT
jgi:hypothetical protein